MISNNELCNNRTPIFGSLTDHGREPSQVCFFRAADYLKHICRRAVLYRRRVARLEERADSFCNCGGPFLRQICSRAALAKFHSNAMCSTLVQVPLTK
jgi:hypothetical protein